MCADGLTKGACDRDSLIVITSTGLWKFVCDVPVAYIAETLRQDFSLYIYIAETGRPEPSLSYGSRLPTSGDDSCSP